MLQRGQLKILLIGNSFTQDAITHLVIGNTARYQVPDENNSSCPYPSVHVDDSNAYAAQLAAVMAVKHPYVVISPEDALPVSGVVVDGEPLGRRNQTVEQWYDLRGHAVGRPERGVYIRNGRKVFVK